MVFYLSSTGHSATTWIAEAFSLHPQVTVYHATRTIPAKSVEDYSDISELPSGYCPKVASSLVDGLKTLEKRDSKVYGSIHTMWGTVCKQPIEKAGGKFGGVVRHPIKQVHSIMNAYLPRALSHGEQKVDYKTGFDYLDLISLEEKTFDLISSQPRNFYNRLVKYIKRLLDKISLTYGHVYAREVKEILLNRNIKAVYDLLDLQMLASVHRVAVDHSTFVKELEPQSILLTEKTTSDQDYLNRKFNHFTGKDFPPDIHVSELKRVRPHSNLSMSPDEIWEHWPDAFKKLFRYKFLETPLKDFYQRQGYWLPA